jgi:hypothetical protein
VRTHQLCYQLKNAEGARNKEVHLRLPVEAAAAAASGTVGNINMNVNSNMPSRADAEQAMRWLSLVQELLPTRLCKRALLAACDYSPVAGGGGGAAAGAGGELRFHKGQTLFEVLTYKGQMFGFTAEEQLECEAATAEGRAGAAMPLLRPFQLLHVRTHPLCEGCVVSKRLTTEKKFHHPRYVWCSEDLQMLFWGKTKPDIKAAAVAAGAGAAQVGGLGWVRVWVGGLGLGWVKRDRLRL